MDQHAAGYLNCYALDVDDAAVVDCKNCMQSLGA